ncbi:MAG: hypothetical protein D6706_02850 [Chloroflexi bacterium]|nr:MAG: hypothetical protein D6706_02850 [Chloroflexota bacterium]
MFNTQVTEFLQSLNADYTRQRYKAALKEFAVWYHTSYGVPPDATRLTDQEARDWRAYLLTVRQLGASSVNLRLAALRSLARHFRLSLRVQGVQRVLPPVEPLTGRELGRLISAVAGQRWLDKRNVAIISLLARAGLRVGEVVTVRIDDLTLSERKGQVVVRHGKGLKERIVPLNRQVRQDVRAYLEVRPSVVETTLFISRTGQPLANRDVQRLVADAARRAGLSRQVTPHTLRHTFATRALRQGKIDLATLSHLLGHSNLTTTARYLHPDQARVAEMIEEL